MHIHVPDEVIIMSFICYDLGGLLCSSISDAEHNSTYTKLGFLEIHSFSFAIG